MDPAKAFMAQNNVSDIDASDLETIETFAEHHAGGLFVLLRYLDNGLIVKLHDSWSDDGMIVVHTYDPDEEYPENVDENVAYFTSAHAAIAYFNERD